MLSTFELEQLTDADVGRSFRDDAGLIGRVRVEARPSARVVVDFMVPLDNAGERREVQAGTWPDRTLAEIRHNADRLRRAAAAPEPALAAPAARALYQGPASAAVHVRPAPRPAAPISYGPLFDTLPPSPVAATQPNPTVTQVFEQWIAHALSARKDHGESVRRSMLKDVLPSLGEMPIRTVRRGHIAAVLERIVERGSARQAGCVLADLRQMFRWATQSALVDADPTAALRKSDFGGSAQARHRHLSEPELAELAAKMNAARLARHIRHAIWLMLATGARIGELAMARWEDIDLERRLWVIPAQYSHSGRAHTVPLSSFALRHLRPEGAAAPTSEWVFPGRYPSEPLSPKALGKQIRDRQRGTQIRGRASATTSLLLTGGAWTPLDLRRSTAALLAELDIRPDVIAACLDHTVRGQAAATPARGAWLEARRDALERLGARLQAIETAHTQRGRLSPA